MNRQERVEMVKAMDFIMRQINDETVFESWLMCGVADGDIHMDYTGEDRTEEDEYLYNMYCSDDESFIELVKEFMNVFYRTKNGGLFVDGLLVLPE